MKKPLISLLLCCALVLSLVPATVGQTHAATQSSYAPYAMIEYGYSSTVEVGTIRYVSQVSSGSHFYSAYWPSSTFGHYTGPSVECGTASISMALSYIGVNKTANDILSANNGGTVFSAGWGGSTYLSISASNLSGAVDNYINGGGKYSPPVIHIPGYSNLGHYVVVAGRNSSGTYQILDPWELTVTTMTVSGSSATYSKYGYTTYDTIDQIHQWYNPNASMDVTATFNGNGGTASTSSKSVSKGGKLGTLPTASRSGYTFLGWYTSTNGGSNPITAATTISEDTTFYAHWQKNTAAGGTSITFDPTGGTLPGAKTSGTLSGSNVARGKDMLVCYTATGQTIKTDHQGEEVSINADGRVTAKRSYGETATLSVPDGGFILSGYGEDSLVSQIAIGDYVDCTGTTVTVYSSYNAYLANRKTASGSYGDLPMPTMGSTPFLGWFTSATGGTQVTASTTLSATTLYAQWGCAHSYAKVTVPAVCGGYDRVKYTCSACGSSYTAYADADCSAWTEVNPGGITETKTQYAYSDRETVTDTQSSLDGYTLVGSHWELLSSGSKQYVASWPAGFSTSHALYTQYNTGKITASEADNRKTVVSSDKVTGYLYYHWCYSGYPYSKPTQQGSYTRFHAFYSTTAPSNYNCDPSDDSYNVTTSTTCSDCTWYFYTPVNTQEYATYQRVYTHEGWSAFSDWSDTSVTAGATRQVKTRTLYRSLTAQPLAHNYVEGICTACGEEDPNYVPPVKDYYLYGQINGATYGWGTDAGNAGGYLFTEGKLVTTFTSDSYVAVKAGDNSKWFAAATNPGTDVTSVTMAPVTAPNGTGLLYVPGNREITFTLTVEADGSVTLSYVAAPPAVVTPSFTGKSLSVSFESEVVYNLYFTADTLESVVEMGLLTWDVHPGTGNVANANYQIPGYTVDAGSGYYCVRSQGIPAKKLGDTLYFRVYAKLTDGSYAYGKIYYYSAKTYAYNILSKTTTSAKSKALAVAMLNYGAAAQTYFGYKPYALMNADLTEEQKALVKTYSASLLEDIQVATSDKKVIFTGNTGFSKRTPNISFEGAFCVNFHLTASMAVQGDVTFYVWSEEDYAKAAYLTTANATRKTTMTLGEDGMYHGSVTGIAAKELDQTVYAVAAYVGTDGCVYYSGIMAYSIGSYCESQANYPTALQPLAKATAVYGYYAKQFFNA